MPVPLVLGLGARGHPALPQLAGIILFLPEWPQESPFLRFLLGNHTPDVLPRDKTVLTPMKRDLDFECAAADPETDLLSGP